MIEELLLSGLEDSGMSPREYRVRRIAGEENQDSSTTPGITVIVPNRRVAADIAAKSAQFGYPLPSAPRRYGESDLMAIDLPEGVYRVTGVQVSFYQQAGDFFTTGEGKNRIGIGHNNIVRIEGQTDLWQNWHFNLLGEPK